MDTATIIRSARASTGLSQAAFAQLAGTHQSAIARLESGRADATIGRINGILQATGSQLAVLPTRLPTIADWAESFRHWIAADDLDEARWAFIQIADNLRSVDPPNPSRPLLDRARNHRAPRRRCGVGGCC